MACKLNEDQVLDVYEILYGEITDRINDSRLPNFNLDQVVKDIYNAVKEEDIEDGDVKALYYAQAVPDIFDLVKQDEEVNDYLVDNDFDFTGLAKMRKSFKDLTEVGKTIATKKKPKEEVDAEIKDANKTKKDVSTKPSTPIDDLLLWTYNQLNGARVTNAWTTSIQVAVAVNPETSTEEERNELDPEKILFSDVVKAITLIARNRKSTSDPIVYEDKELALTAVRTSSIDSDLLTSSDKAYIEASPEDKGIIAIVSDEQGNLLYFNEDGTLTDNPEEGRIVYQYLRKVNNVKGKLLLSNRANRKYNLVEPEVLAKRQAEKIEDEGGKPLTKKQFEKLVKKIDERQKVELNTLYALRNMLEEDSSIRMILPIVHGTLGQTNAKKITMSLQEAGYTESDVKNYNAITTGKRSGYQYVLVEKKVPGKESTEPFELTLQRGDMDEQLAEKISEVLTTKARLRGRELTPSERQKYFEIYVNNAREKGSVTNRDRIQVKVLNVNNKEVYTVFVNGEKVSEDILFTNEGKQMIKNHLLNAIPKLLKKGQKEEGENGYFPANVHYNNSLKGKTFTDYVIEGDTITEQTVKHWDAIKNYIKVELTNDILNYEKGLNAYLTYTIPEGLIEDVDDIDVGRQKKLKEKKSKTNEESEDDAKKSKRRGWKFPRKKGTKSRARKKKTDKEEKTTLSKSRGFNMPKKGNKKASAAEQKKENVKRNPSTRTFLLDDVLNNNKNSKDIYKKKGGLPRAKDKYLDNVFASKADRKAAEKWWASSPLSKYISLERITQITNSNAFATWSKYGITLYEADGGTSVDLYHEAWHGFSQLFLTQDDKVNLYEELRALPKYAKKSYETLEDLYLDIEEDLAEQFRTYAKSKGKGKVKGFLGRIFDAIYSFIQKLFGKTTKKQAATDLLNVESVKELYDKLYRASENPSLLSNLTPSMDNVMFTKLNRTKTINENFSITESKQVVDAMDSMAALIFEQYNLDFETTTGAVDLLKDLDNKKEFFRDMYDRFERLRLAYVKQVEEDIDLISDPTFLEEIELLDKITDNFIGPNDVFDLGAKNNVISYFLQKSKFKVLRDEYIEIEDPTDLTQSTMFKLKDDNSISAKKLAKEETMMLLASMFKTNMENGEPVRVRGLFGLPVLQDTDITWNRLAKILQGSFDEMEMYNRLYENIENYPEIQQLLDSLPNPYRIVQGPEYSSSEEFQLETAFWQDFKKPRIPYIQLNLNKDQYKSGDQVVKEFEARIARANFDVYQVIRDWKSNFITADSSVNEYIEKNDLNINILQTADIIKEFGVNGNFNYNKSREFLKALGIVLDESSVAIREIIDSTENPFHTRFGLDRMYEVIKIVNKSNSEAALAFKKDPLTMLINGLPENLREDEDQSNDVRSRVRALAEIQNMYSDGYSNFSSVTPEGNRVWEHMVDNTITRIVTAINNAENWQELTTDAADPNGRYKHMRWLNEANNTFSPYSKLINSVFDLDPMSKSYGEKISDTKIILQHVAGTQMISKRSYAGSNTASMDATSKYLQELHTMLLNGVEEFMRHASKNTAMGMTVQGEIKTYNGKNESKLYVDIESFLSYGDGEIKSYDIVEGYIAAEANRIVRFKQNKEKFKNYAGYNRPVKRKDGNKTSVMAGEAFTAFDDVLTETTQQELYTLLDKASEDKTNIFDLTNVLNDNPELREKIRTDVYKYFNKDTAQNLTRLNEAKHIDQKLYDRISDLNPDLTNKDIETTLVKAYTYNSFIHKMETTILAYGDLVQYNHAKEEFHKRNAGLASGGKGFRADRRAQAHISSLKKYYADRMGKESRNYDGTLKTAIIKEIVMPSEMYKEYRQSIYDTVYARTGSRTKAKKYADTAADEYLKMKVADGQGWITFEAYRQLKRLEGNWSVDQEDLYRKVSMDQNITAEDIVQYFPSYKLQYFGNIESTGLPVTSFHKFSLAPIIPGVAKKGTPMYELHQKMMDDQIDYVTLESGSKVSHIGTGDVVLNEDGSFNKESKFTVNTIFAEFLKNQTEVNPEYKKKTIFSTQLRKLILEGLYERGVIQSTKFEEITNDRVRRYVDHVEEYTELLKLELLEEMGYEETSPGQYKPKDKSSTAKLLNMIRTNLEREDVLSDDLIEFIDVFEESGELVHDLSFHPEASKIEKLILSMINKRVIKQKVNGEPLVQVSVGMFANQFTKPDLRKASKDEIAKWTSASYLLPTYHKKSNGYTAATKVMIAMQGGYYNLFNLKYENDEIIAVYNDDGKLNMDQSLKRLNEKIKDDSWLDANDGANRKAVTLVGVRIPVQGLNSMEFAEVFEFLPPQAGNIIISPAELVAKSGGDFDIDKLTIFMNTLNEDGSVVKRKYDNLKSVKDLKGTSDFDQAMRDQKAALENEIINDIKEILELPENYTSLVMPNGTFILKGIADELAKYVSKYNPKKNKMTEETGEISPTRVLEALYNIYKHESNIVGKKTLGLGAVENTFNVILNSIGAYMPDAYTVKKTLRQSNLRLKHNIMDDPKGRPVISMSNMYDVEGLHKIADVISQMMNGWVDIEKDAWIFNIQGNYEVAPTLIYLVKAGVPVREAIFFVSNPLVREYVNEQRLHSSTYADVLDKDPGGKGLVRYKAASEVIKRFFTVDELSSRSKNDARYEKGVQMLNKVLGKRKYFKESEMMDIIVKGFKEVENKNGEVEMVLNTEFLKKDEKTKAMFLHFLELEQQIGGYTKLKISSNPDTKLQTSLSNVEQTEASLDELYYDSRIPTEIVDAMRNDSILKSFYNGPLALAVSKPLYKLRFHPAITEFLIGRKERITQDMEIVFPGQDIELFSNVFRNDLVSYILQNSIRRYDMKNKKFMSLDFETKIPTKLVKELKRGAHVKDGILYMDMKRLEKEFRKNAWEEDSDVKNSYEKRGLYPLDPNTFMTNSETNFDQYVNFVAQREYLRYITPLNKEFAKRKDFREELENTKQLFPEFKQEKAVRYTYEKLIAVEALDKSYNLYHLFESDENAFAIRFNSMLNQYPELSEKYSVIGKLKLDGGQEEGVYNIYLADKDFDNDKSTLLTEQLKELANPGYAKVADPQENLRISNMFKYLNLYSFLQTGLNKTKLNFTNLVDYSDFLTILESEASNFISQLDKNGDAILENYYDIFIKQNNDKINPNNQRFKDYMTDLDIKSKPKQEPKPETVLDETNMDEEVVEKRVGLKLTDESNVYTYNDKNAKTNAYYSNLSKNNTDVVFLHNTSVFEIRPEQIENDIILGGSSRFMSEVPDMSINFPTNLYSHIKDGFKEDLPSSQYDMLKKIWERRITKAKEIQDKNGKLAFPEYGFGSKNEMPEELFVYLSKRLFEEFGYVNPGSTKYDQIMKMVGESQGITNEEILIQLELEEDPFKCV